MPVKNSQGYTLRLQAPAWTPSDSTDYYFGATHMTLGAATSSKTLIPKNGVITGFYLFVIVTGVVATAEDSILAIRLNNTTDYNITSTLKFNASNFNVTKSDLNIPVVAGDYIEIKCTTPAWVTNPTSIYMGGHILIRD